MHRVLRKRNPEIAEILSCLEERCSRERGLAAKFMEIVEEASLGDKTASAQLQSLASAVREGMRNEDEVEQILLVARRYLLDSDWDEIAGPIWLNDDLGRADLEGGVQAAVSPRGELCPPLSVDADRFARNLPRMGDDPAPIAFYGASRYYQEETVGCLMRRVTASIARNADIRLHQLGLTSSALATK
ncbi:hypothetical protein [Simplicispira metamorpha]|uniref:Uncharacterized protein n=1 Tax=Simplicispira metamorpha TaxID=80881 RepID=A0A4R2N0P4_9BURK|nr:hypothetical protein [Simplicispira metamorpha]TCP12974.1 hypothetical protein EV674_13530 [Simplicispira metamorpha]